MDVRFSQSYSSVRKRVNGHDQSDDRSSDCTSPGYFSNVMLLYVSDMVIYLSGPL